MPEAIGISGIGRKSLLWLGSAGALSMADGFLPFADTALAFIGIQQGFSAWGENYMHRARLEGHAYPH